MVTLVLVSVPITSLNVLNDIVALTLLHGAKFLSVFDQPSETPWLCCFSVCTATASTSPTSLTAFGLFPSAFW